MEKICDQPVKMMKDDMITFRKLKLVNRMIT